MNLVLYPGIHIRRNQNAIEFKNDYQNSTVSIDDDYFLQHTTLFVLLDDFLGDKEEVDLDRANFALWYDACNSVLKKEFVKRFVVQNGFEWLCVDGTFTDNANSNQIDLFFALEVATQAAIKYGGEVQTRKIVV